MASTQKNPALLPPGGSGQVISPEESARYTAEMLESMRKIAARQGQLLLAHLLELAQAEARILIRAPQDTPA